MTPKTHMTKEKKIADGVAQVVKHLPSKCETLCSNPSIEKKEKEYIFVSQRTLSKE
jgi:hypothetical protein